MIQYCVIMEQNMNQATGPAYIANYILLKANMALESNFFEELVVNSTFSYGGGIAYSLNSLVGPVELGLNISNRHYTPSLFVNIGFFF